MMTAFMKRLVLSIGTIAFLAACSNGESSDQTHEDRRFTNVDLFDGNVVHGDQDQLIDVAWDHFDVLVSTTDRAREEMRFAHTKQDKAQLRHFADRVSNTRHEFDKVVINALRAGASPETALRMLRSQDGNFDEITILAESLSGVSMCLEAAILEIFETRARLIRLLSTASLPN